MPTARRLACLVIGIAACALARPADAGADPLELAGRITATDTLPALRRAGDARYITLSDLFYRDRYAYLEVLDLSTQAVAQVRIKRATIERYFGVARDGGVAVPRVDVVLFRPDRAGLVVLEPGETTASARRSWYIEIDPATGKLLRAAGLARLAAGEYLQIVGADAARDQAWFAIASAGEVVLRRIELHSLAVTDEARIPLTVAKVRTGYEREPRVHAAPDFSRFAVVEYHEAGRGMAPGLVHVIDPATRATFAVPAPPTAYGVAFSRDGRHLYLGSSQLGTISRVDLAAGKIDKQVAGPRQLHHLVVSPGGTRLLALSSSTSYAAFDLPDLKRRTDHPHPAGLAALMAQLFGAGVVALDGAYFVVPDATPRGGAGRGYVIARVRD